MALSLRIILACFLLILFMDCSKNNGDNDMIRDTIAPTITIISPANNEEFTSGQTIRINAESKDNIEVTELHVYVTDKTTTNLLRHIHSYPFVQHGSVQDSFPAQTGVNYVIQIVSNDAKQNLTSRQVEVFTVN